MKTAIVLTILFVLFGCEQKSRSNYYQVGQVWLYDVSQLKQRTLFSEGIVEVKIRKLSKTHLRCQIVLEGCYLWIETDDLIEQIEGSCSGDDGFQ